jgi:hypothetical protein
MPSTLEHDVQIPHVNGVNDRFMRVTLGNVLTILVLITSMSAMYFRDDGRITAVEVSTTRAEKDRKDNDDKLEKREDENRKRIDELEKVGNDINKRLEKIDTNISWLMDNMKSQKK